MILSTYEELLEKLGLSEANPLYVLPLRPRRDQQSINVLNVSPVKGTFDNLDNPHNT